MSKLHIGVVGLGWVAGAHINTFKNVVGAEVTAVCSRRELDESQLERQYGIPLRAYQSYHEMLRDPEINVIDVCTPHPFHPEQAIAAAQAGKHLIIEKPVALTFEDAQRMREAIDEAGVHTCVCFEVRFSQHATLIRSTIDEGLLGALHYGEVDYYHGIGPWYGQFAWNIKKELGGSSLLTAGCHALDLLLYFMEGEVEEVTSYHTQTKNPIFEPYEYDTTSVTLLKFKDGRVGKVASVVDCLQPYYFHIHLVGSAGSLLDNRIYSSKLNGLSKHRWSTLETPLIDSGDVADHPYQPQFQSFIDSIRNNEPMPLTNFASAYETHRVVFAADRSAQEGRPVKLSEFAPWMISSTPLIESRSWSEWRTDLINNPFPVERYLCANIRRFPIGNNSDLVYFQDDRSAHILPSEIAKVLDSCQHFLTLEIHLEEIAANLSLNAEQVQVMRSCLEIQRQY